MPTLTDDPNTTAWTPPAAVAELSPAAQQVYTLLVLRGPLTQQALVRYGMHQRTARDALARLREVGVLEQWPSPQDARQSVYEVVEPDA